ncbi:hypothetical protein ABH931_006085 [Streptacidiphilus sp. MAP12-33]|uniref:ERF family protein n=1 Tax=Streptacidiphilus sp. MAP12-33 TaxID=3156266 RepID=UPI003513B23F
MSSLSERAAAAAQQPAAPAPVTPEPEAPQVGIQDLGADYEAPDAEPDAVPVHVAWSRVMADIRKIGKSEVYNAPGTHYNFRGVDRTVNAFAPALRRHGVLVLPTKVEAKYRDFVNGNKKLQRECTVVVTWTVMGPQGDVLAGQLQSAGEALDSADKGTAKAQSVALRVFLLTAAMVPTGDPDPDSAHVDRGDAPQVKSPEQYRDEMVNPKTSAERLYQIADELRQFHLSGIKVQNETGDMETLWALGTRLYQERGGQ